MQARLAGKFRQSAPTIENNTIMGLTVAGWQLARLSASLAPTDTGDLAASITYTSPVSVGLMRYSTDVGSGIKYGRFQELGTWKMQAQPYLRPATWLLRRQMANTIALYAIGRGRGVLGG